MIRIKLITLGNLKYPVDFKKIEGWHSNVFKAVHADEVQVIPNAEGTEWSYPDSQLAVLITPDKQYDFSIGIINAELQDNYYIRRLKNNVCIFSLYETAEILRYSNLTIENFIVRNLYEFCLIYLEGGRQIKSSAYTVAHDETRGCLFDMNANKSDIIFSTEHPKICTSCKARIMNSQVPKDSLRIIEKELGSIKKALYSRVMDFVKSHPIYTLIISSCFALLLNIFASFIYDKVMTR